MNYWSSTIWILAALVILTVPGIAEDSSDGQTKSSGIDVQGVFYDSYGTPPTGNALERAVAMSQVVFVGTFRDVFPANPADSGLRAPGHDLRWVAILDVSEALKGKSYNLRKLGVFVHSPALTWHESVEHLIGRQCIYCLQMKGNKIYRGELLCFPSQYNENFVRELQERIGIFK